MEVLTMGELQNTVYENIINQASQEIDGFTPESLPPAMLKKIIQQIQVETAKEQVKNDIRKSKVNIDKVLNGFFADTSKGSKKAPGTIKLYTLKIKAFLNWLQNKNIHFLDVTGLIANDYLNHLNSRALTPNTRQNHMNTLKSFYSYLVKFYDLSLNPFHGFSVRVTETDVKEKIVPSDYQINIIREEIQRRIETNKRRPANKDYLLAFDLLSLTGCRLDFISNFKIVNNGSDYMLIGKSKKTKDYKVKHISPEMVKRIKKANLSQFNKNAFSEFFTRVINKLNNNVQDITPHCLRHKKAVQVYTINNSVLEVKEVLNHASLETTIKYLRSCGINNIKI